MALEDSGRDIDGALARRDGKGLAFENAFSGVTSFLRRPYVKEPDDGFDVVVTGIPFDQAVTNRPGARFGPRAIREASTLLPFDPPFGWDVDPLTHLAVADAGDMPFDYARPGDIEDRIKRHAEALVGGGAVLVALGGDHSISLPLLRAARVRHGPLALLQFDAHPDTWTDDDPSRVDHGTGFYKALEEGLIDPAHSVQVGIRIKNPDPPRLRQIGAPEVHGLGPDAVASRIRETVGEAPVYLSFDIDALDPAFAPGTGTPVCGGLSTAQCGAILRSLAGIRLVGADVVEVSPPYDHAGITALAGATMALDALCLVAAGSGY